MIRSGATSGRRGAFIKYTVRCGGWEQQREARFVLCTALLFICLKKANSGLEYIICVF